MPRKIVKKILPEYFDLIASGEKKFEFRVADFEVTEGDILVLEEWDGVDSGSRKPTGRSIEKRVTFLKKFNLDEFDQKEEIEKHGFYILQIE